MGKRGVYEAEKKIDGKGRDLLLDQTGIVVETEDEVDIETIQAPARSAIQKRAAGGSVLKVEKVTTGRAISFEGTIRMKFGKTVEFAANAAGTPHQED